MTTKVKQETSQKTRYPKRYNVFLHNDDYTTMEFVVYILNVVFQHSEEKAIEIMMQVHQAGKGIAGLYTKEVAESKKAVVDRLAKEQQYPLKCSIEQADDDQNE